MIAAVGVDVGVAVEVGIAVEIYVGSSAVRIVVAVEAGFVVLVGIGAAVVVVVGVEVRLVVGVGVVVAIAWNTFFLQFLETIVLQLEQFFYNGKNCFTINCLEQFF